MTRWEYRVCVAGREADLNTLGEDGWELMAAVYNSDRMTTVTYFKRPTGGA